MNAIVAVLVLFVGAAVTAPQGPAQYQPQGQVQYQPQGQAQYQPQGPAQFQPSRPVVKANYGYRPPSPPPTQEVERYPSPSPPVSQISEPVESRFRRPQPYSVIVKQSQEDNFDGSFNYNFEADNGIAVQSSGYLKDAGTENEAQVIQGTYSYTAPDGTPIVTNWFADETGFHVEGAHLPVAPPLPEAIAKLVAFHRSLPQTEERSQKGQEQ